MRSTVEKDVFKGFQMDDETNFSILQYTEDSIIVGKETQDNLWALKAIFRSYELVSGLRINFHKSSIYGINIDGLFLQAAENQKMITHLKPPSLESLIVKKED